MKNTFPDVKIHIFLRIGHMLIDVTKTWMKVEEGHFPMGLFLSLRADSLLPRLSVRLSELFRPILFLVKWTSTRSGLRRIESPDWFAYVCACMPLHEINVESWQLVMRINMQGKTKQITFQKFNCCSILAKLSHSTPVPAKTSKT